KEKKKKNMQNAYARPTVPSDSTTVLSYHSSTWTTTTATTTSAGAGAGGALHTYSENHSQTEKMDSGANSPGLKLKIKLGAQAMTDGSASPRSSKEDDETNPLKIIIKKTDLSTSGGALVNLLSFPELGTRPK